MLISLPAAINISTTLYFSLFQLVDQTLPCQQALWTFISKNLLITSLEVSDQISNTRKNHLEGILLISLPSAIKIFWTL